MTHVKNLAILFAVVAGIAACASNPTPNASVAKAQLPGDPLPQPRWTGSIRAVVTDKLNEGDSTRERSYGTLVWTPGATPALSNAKIDFTYAGSARELTWGIFFGPCGNASLPVITLSDFPELEMSAGGRTQVTAALSIDLPTSGAFHVEIFKDRSGDRDFSVACGNLRFNRG
ncbi:MAG TPA: hypothetical protein VM053_00490 [Gemmatimonadaceae bacterium]|nr:hypothetical protein [Gemmatimonadaceae bacterium]